MAHCINKSHPDFIVLMSNTNLSAPVLAAKVSVWMDENTSERFPSKEELGLGEVFYQKNSLNEFQQKAKNIFFQAVWNKSLTDSEIDRVNSELLKLSRFIGDSDWHLRQSQKGSWYIAGYKNRPVTSEDYFSPFASGMFRQKDSKSTEGPNEHLNKKLFEWAKNHGISVEAMETLLEKFEGRYAEGILGVADFANAIIGIADNSKIDTLPEEVAHFAIEILKDHPSIKRALETISSTTTYEIVKEEYSDVYNTEEQFRKEALGKLLAAEIVDQFNNTKSVEKSGSIWQYIKTAANQFINWVQSNFSKGTDARTDLDSVIKPLAMAILENQYLGEFGVETSLDAPIFYQKEPTEEEQDPIDISIEKKKRFIEEAIFKLGSRAQLLERSDKNTTVLVSIIKKEIADLEKSLVTGQLDLAISGFIKLAELEIDQVEEVISRIKEKGNISEHTVNTSRAFIEMYEELFKTFRKNMLAAGIPLEETREIRENIGKLAARMQDVQGIVTSLQSDLAIKALDEANTDHNGNKIDQTLNSSEIVNETKEDIGFWRLWVGNYKYANSSVVRSVHKIIFDSVSKVKRFAVQKANELLQAQENHKKAGGNILDIVEKDADGKPTHYFIREYYWQRYYATMEKTKEAIAEELGFDNYSMIQTMFLSPTDMKKFRAMWGKFYKEHTVVKKVVNDKGDTLEFNVPNNNYLNPDYAKLSPTAKILLDKMITTKKEAVAKLPHRYRTDQVTYMLPPILKSNLDRLTTNEGFLTKIAKLGREALFVDADDTQFGQLNVFNNKMVPVHFTRALDNVNDLSLDLVRSTTLFAEMAENFREMNKISGSLTAIKDTIADRKYINRKGIREDGVTSKDFQAINIMMDTHVFGVMRDAKATDPLPENFVTNALGIAGKKFSVTKASQKFTGFIRDNNLAFNLASSLSGWLKGSGDSIIEDAIGLYTNHESKNWARAEFGVNLYQVIGEIGKAKKQNKMHLILQEAEIEGLDKILHETDKNRAARKLLNKDVFYTTFASGDYGMKGRITLAIYDNHRLYKGKFYTRAQYVALRSREIGLDQKTAKTEWKDLREKSLYNAYEVIDGQLVVKKEFEAAVTPGLLNSVKGKIEHVTTYVDGTLSPTDKGALARGIAGDFLLMHRGWFIGLMDTRFRAEKVNIISGEEEIGTYRASAGFLYQVFYQSLIKDKAGLMASLATYHTLSPAKKRGVLKTALDLLYLQIVAIVAAMANLAADDEPEDYTLQYTAYQLNRVLLEQGAAFSISELIQLIEQPVVGARMIKDLSELSEAFNFSEIYEGGMYEGKSHATKWWMKKLPSRNIYELQFPEMKNKFIKGVVDSKYYKLLSPEEKSKLAKEGNSFGFFRPEFWEALTTDYTPEKKIIETLDDESDDF